MKVTLVIISLGIFCGCALNPTVLLDKYFEIQEVGDKYRNEAENLSKEVETLVDHGDSLIVLYKEVVENNKQVSVGTINSVNAFFQLADGIVKKTNHLNLNLRVFDRSLYNYFIIINSSKYRRKIQTETHYNVQLPIKEALLSPAFDALILTQTSLSELVNMMEYQSKLLSITLELEKLNRLTSSEKLHKYERNDQ